MKKNFWFTFALAVALALGVGGVSWAESPEEAASEATVESEVAVESEEAAMPVYGMQAWIDSETGGFRAPTAAEAAEMSAKLQKIFGKAKFEPKLFRFKNGMLAAELDPSMFKFSVMRIDEDGHQHTNCTHGVHNALEFIETPSKASGREEQ